MPSEMFYNAYPEEGWQKELWDGTSTPSTQEYVVQNGYYDDAEGYVNQTVGFPSTAFGVYGTDVSTSHAYTQVCQQPRQDSSQRSYHPLPFTSHGGFSANVFPLSPAPSDTFSSPQYPHHIEKPSAAQITNEQEPSTIDTWPQTTYLFDEPTTPSSTSTRSSTTLAPSYTTSQPQCYPPSSPHPPTSPPSHTLPPAPLPSHAPTTTSISTSTSPPPANVSPTKPTKSITVTCECGEQLHGPHANGNLNRHRRSLKCSTSNGKKHVTLFCESCATPFRRSDALLNHRRKKHGAPPATPRT